MKTIFFQTATFAMFCGTFFIAAVSVNTAADAVKLGFPIINHYHTEITLKKDDTLGSAFLLQLRRQALLIAARDEFNAVTCDTVLGEGGMGDTVLINSIDEIAESQIPYTNHQEFLVETEKLSRTVFVAELQKRGLQKKELPKTEKNTEKTVQEIKEIETLLKNWSQIPQFDAVRRTHRLIQQQGESQELLTLLVKGYTQLQLLTNFAPLETHRVFQARAMLYAQRAAVKYAATPEILSLRAAAWSLNNFHRIARNEFAALKETKPDTWTALAKLYADFDFKGLDKQIETLNGTPDKPFAELLYFFLLQLANEGANAGRVYGEKIISDLPNCERLYQETFANNTFDMIYAPNKEPFYIHLQRQTAAELLKITELPDEAKEEINNLHILTKKPENNLLNNVVNSLLGKENSGTQLPRGFYKQEQYYAALQNVIQKFFAVQATGEPSLPDLAVLLWDSEFNTVRYIADGVKSHNGAAESIIQPAMPVVSWHPAMQFLVMLCRDQSVRFALLKETWQLPSYNLYSQQCIGYGHQRFTQAIMTQNDPLYYHGA